MVYLPERGVPVTLCVIKDSRPDESIAQKKVDGMTAVSWRQNELAYALIGTPLTLPRSRDLHLRGRRGVTRDPRRFLNAAATAKGMRIAHLRRPLRRSRLQADHVSVAQHDGAIQYDAKENRTNGR
jgi:hypothetical protein